MNSNHLPDILKTAKLQMDGGKYAQAVQTLEFALEFDPELWLESEIYFQAALCKCELKDYAGAVENLETALSIAGDVEYAEKKHIYGILRIAYTHKPDHLKLAELCRMLLSIEEDKTDIVINLFYAYIGSENWEELAKLFDDNPDIDFGKNTSIYKSISFRMTGRYKEAFYEAGKYIERFGDNHEVLANLMEIYYEIGDGARGVEYYKKAIVLCDDPVWRQKTGCQLLFKDLYHGVISDGEFPGIVDDIRRNTEKLQTNTAFDNTLKPFRKIRIGYLSADFRKHPVGYFLLPVMMSTVNSHCSNLCFNLTKPKDEDDTVTRHFKSLADIWEEVYERPDSYIEQLFLTKKVDIAFDVMGQTAYNRLQLYARRLAPLQISWIGAPVTSGIAAMDYVITDRNVDPPGSEKYYTEKLLYMPECFLCTTLSGIPKVETPAFTRNGYITFACFHNLIKITDKTLRLWRVIMERCENSRLKIMGYLPAGEEKRELFDERVRMAGLPMEQVAILPMRDQNDYFTAYNDVDIMLDTYPFSGATTTFDALRMGRPIITLVGERHVTRVSHSLLLHVGLDDLAAFSEDEYVEKAVELANDHERLRKINDELPRLVENSPLTNQPVFRKNFEKIIRDAWVGYCFKKRVGDYDYGDDSPAELLEQIINATVYLERKLDAGVTIDDPLASEYYSAQKAFLTKLSLVTNNEELVRGYENLVGMIERSTGEKNLRMVITTAKKHINTLCNREILS